MKFCALLSASILAFGVMDAKEESVRIAVVSDATNRDLAALVTTELSAKGTVTVVERDALAKAGDELKVQQLAGHDATALGRIAGANGLLFLDERSGAPHVRFTAVNLGYALFDDPVPALPDLTEEAKALAHLVLVDAPKLKLSPAKALPLSMLNLRADFPGADAEPLERNLTLLLESRLAAVPEYVVLERRHAWSLGFEAALDPTARHLLEGARLIDGTISIAADDCTVAVRVRDPQGRVTLFSVAGKVGNLTALADQILVHIRQILGGTAAPMPSLVSREEAADYLSEGIWGRRAHALPAALEALDSAELLGARTPDVEVERIPVLYALADEGMEEWFPLFDSIDKAPVFDAPALEERATAAIRALREAALYESQKMEASVDPALLADQTERFLARTSNLEAWTVYRASKVLYLADRMKSSRADELRQALRPVTGYDPFHGKAGRPYPTNVNNDNSRAEFADDWAQTLAEELAYYRLVCSDTKMALPFSTVGWSIDRFCGRFYTSSQERTRAFWNFVDSLKDDPASRLSYCLLRARAGDSATADAAYRDFLGELGKDHSQWEDPKRNRPLLNNVFTIPDDVKTRNAAAALPLIHYLLSLPHPQAGDIAVLVMLWRPAGFPAADAPQLWAEWNTFSKIAEQAGGVPGRYSLQPLADDFRAHFPGLVSAPPVPSPDPAALEVTRFWSPGLAVEGLKKNFQILSTTVAADGAWISGIYTFDQCPPAVFHVDLSDFATKAYCPPEAHASTEMAVTTNAVYLLAPLAGDTSRHELVRYDLKSNLWQVRPMPDFAMARLFGIDDALYLFTTSREHETSFVRYDWGTDGWIILASNRRRPARNQFDDAPPAIFCGGIFDGPRHRPCVYVSDGTYYMSEKPGPWPQVFNGAFGNQCITIGNRTLVCSASGEAVMLDGDAAAPEYWMANKLPRVRQVAAADRKPRKEVTPWAAHANWSWSVPEKQLAWGAGVAFEGENLFLLEKPVAGRPLTLLCYSKGSPSPQRISLKFHFDAETGARLSFLPATGRDIVRLSIDQLQHPERPGTEPMQLCPQLIGTHQGLCLQFVFNGFWFIPFSDIETCLTGRPRAAASPDSVTGDNAGHVPAKVVSGGGGS